MVLFLKLVTCLKLSINFFSVPSTWDCNFDLDTFCSWTQDLTNTLDWTIQKGATAKFDTGPTSDHSSGNGLLFFFTAVHCDEQTK